MFKSLFLMFFLCLEIFAADNGVISEPEKLANYLELVDSCFVRKNIDNELFEKILSNNARFKAKIDEIESWATAQKNSRGIMKKYQSENEDLTSTNLYDALIDYWIFKKVEPYALARSIPGYREFLIKGCLDFLYDLAEHTHNGKTWLEFEQRKNANWIVMLNGGPLLKSNDGSYSFVNQNLIPYFIIRREYECFLKNQ